MDFSELNEFGLATVNHGDYSLSKVEDCRSKVPAENRSSKSDRMVDTACDNFEQILVLAGNVIEIKKMKVQSEAILKKMAEDRKALVAEAEAYAIKRNADTQSVVEKMNLIRLMLKDFYEASNGHITSEDFRIIITETINSIGKLE